MHPLLTCTLAAALALTTASASLAQQSAPHVQPMPQPAPPPPQPLASTYPGPPASGSAHYSVSSNIMSSKLIQAVPPIYPINAENNHITGVVVLQAVIAKNGSVAKIDVISGPAQLRQAAVSAVQQWRYRPTMKDGVPVEVVTRININFNLNGH